MFYCYEHIRNDTLEIFYVGKGKNSRAYSKQGRNKLWNRIVHKSGGFTVRKIVENLDEELAFLVEIERIDQLRRIGTFLANCTDGGEGVSGYKATEDTKRKISKALIGNTFSEGMVHTKETKLKVSKALKGRVFSEEHRKKLSLVQMGQKKALGHKHSRETIQKMVESATGRLHSEETKNKLSNIAKSRPKLTCPHCGKVGDLSNMVRWHFDNCKSKYSLLDKGSNEDWGLGDNCIDQVDRPYLDEEDTLEVQHLVCPSGKTPAVYYD